MIFEIIKKQYFTHIKKQKTLFKMRKCTMLQKYELLLNLVAVCNKKVETGPFFPHSIIILHYIVKS